MRKIILAFLILIAPCAVYGQTTIVQSTQLTWDDSNPPGITEEFRMYCQEGSSSVVIGPATLRAQILAPNNTWVNDLTVGNWWCVVTAVRGALESDPSNELGLDVILFGGPINLRVIPQ